MVKRKVRNPSMLQISVPVEVYDAVGQLAEFEGSTMSQIGRRALIGYLVQAGLVRPPQLKAVSQTPPAS